VCALLWDVKANAIRVTKGTQKLSYLEVKIIRKTKAWIGSHVRVWFEFIWLRVETGRHRLGRLKSYCVKKWNLIGVSDWGVGMAEVPPDVFLMGRPLCSISYPLTHWRCRLGAFAEDC